MRLNWHGAKNDLNVYLGVTGDWSRCSEQYMAFDSPYVHDIKVKVRVYSPHISGLYINNPRVWELACSQSHLAGVNAGHFMQLKPFT